MTYGELNKYILNYLENDKTKSAIMLTGAWGIGKSYYIEHNLKEFMKDNGKDCVVISLYGLNELSEISKSLYFEAKHKKFIAKVNKLKSKFKNAEEGEIIAKTIFKGVISHYGINLSLSDSSIQKLYNSVDFKNRLIVLEDIERTSINIIELLGYVNNLVEQDGVKVLLVCNEEEFVVNSETKYNNNSDDHDPRAEFDIIYSLLQQRRDERKKNSDKTKPYSEEIQNYLKTKEKTISDSIKFDNNLVLSLKQIIENFNNEKLNSFADDKTVSQLVSRYIEEKFNLRTFIFACQKTVNIFKHLENIDINGNDFYKTIFFGVVYFSFYIKTVGRIPDWEGDEICSRKLGTEDYPLFYFCYYYIKYHLLKLDDIDKYVKYFSKNKILLSSSAYNDENINIIENYYWHPKETVLKALNELTRKLSETAIPFTKFGKIIRSLVRFHKLFNYDYTEIKELMKKWVAKYAADLNPDYHFGLIITPEAFKSPEEKNEYKGFIDELKAIIITGNKKSDTKFDYNPETIKDYSSEISGKENLFADGKGFLSTLDVEKFFEMMKKCNAVQLYELNILLTKIYGHDETELYGIDNTVLKERFTCDIEPLKLLNDKINDYCTSFSGDEIIKEWFERIHDYLKRVIEILCPAKLEEDTVEEEG